MQLVSQDIFVKIIVFGLSKCTNTTNILNQTK